MNHVAQAPVVPQPLHTCYAPRGQGHCKRVRVAPASSRPTPVPERLHRILPADTET